MPGYLPAFGAGCPTGVQLQLASGKPWPGGRDGGAGGLGDAPCVPALWGLPPPGRYGWVAEFPGGI